MSAIHKQKKPRMIRGFSFVTANLFGFSTVLSDFELDESGILQQLSIDFAAIILGKCVDEFDPARVLVLSQSRSHKLLDVIRYGFAGDKAFARDDEGFRLHQTIAIVVTDDRAFEHGFVLQQTIFYLSRRDEDAANFQHV